jgi:Flp pilus assembly CpaE family ATPase
MRESVRSDVAPMLSARCDWEAAAKRRMAAKAFRRSAPTPDIVVTGSLMNSSVLSVLHGEDNPVNARVVEAMLEHTEPHTFQVQRAESLVTALDLLAHSSFDVALVDLMLPDSEGLQTFLTIQRHAPRVPIVVLSGLDNEPLALKAMTEGAQDYLTKGALTKEALIRAVCYAVARSQNAPEQQFPSRERATVVGILGAKGGVGTTTIACHLALQLKRQSGKDVLLLDLDSSSASASFYLKAESQYTVLDAATSLQRLDADLWKAFVTSASGDIDLLCSPGCASPATPLSGDRVQHVLRFASEIYGYIVVDLGRLNPATLPLIEEMRDIFAVTTMDLPSLFESKRALKRLSELGVAHERLHLILNRKSKKGSDVDLENAIGWPMYAVINDYSEELADAFAGGRFLGDQPKMNAQVAKLVSKWLGPTTPTTGQTERRGVAQVLSRFISKK